MDTLTSAGGQTIPKSASVHILVALFQTPQGTGAYHWALVVSDAQPDRDSKEVQIYQIEENDSQDWKLAHDRRVLRKTQDFLGCVDFKASSEARLDHVDQFMRSYEAKDDSPSRFPPHMGWNCAAWVLRALNDLNESAMIAIPSDMDRVKQRIIAKAMLLEHDEHRVPIVSFNSGLEG